MAVFLFFVQIFVLLCFNQYIAAQSEGYHPPTIYGDRNWVIPDNTPIGTLVKKIEASDVDNDVLEYGLEHSVGYNIVQSDAQPLPFKVDRKLGYVYTNRSLLDLGGHNIYMYVTVFDGYLTAKVQVWVKIENTSAVPEPAGSSYHHPPSIPNIGSFPLGKSNVPFPFNRNQRPSTKLSSVNSTNNLTSSITTDTTFIKTTNKSLGNVDENSSSLPKEVNNVDKPFSKTSNNKTDDDMGMNLSSNDNKILLVVFPIMIVISVLISSAMACIFRKRICSKPKKLKTDDMKKSTSARPSSEESVALQHWIPRIQEHRYDIYDTDSNNTQITKSTDNWEFPRHHIKVFNILGEGCFGQVWKCEALNLNHKEGSPTVVAVKMLKENAGERERLDLLQELQVMKMLEPHPNVVKLLGCCTEKDPIFVIMEYVSNGKLQTYLRHSRAQRAYDNMYGVSNTLTSRDLIVFCYQIAKGMQYLSTKGIIHRDLAARNILITEDRTCKVADFGFARDLMTNLVYERKSDGRLPIRWMAPESLYDNMFSVKSDIWSYGVLVWEIVTLGSTPYPGISAAEVMRRVRDGYRLEKPEHCHRELYNIMYYCWDKDPKERPNFTELVDLLDRLLVTEMDYIQLDRFPDHSYYNIISLSGEKL